MRVALLLGLLLSTALAAAASAAPRRWRSCSGHYVGAPEGWRHVFSKIRVRMETIEPSVQCSDGRYVTRKVAASYDRKGLLPAHPVSYASCTYKSTRSGIEHATCRLYTSDDLVRFSIRPEG